MSRELVPATPGPHALTVPADLEAVRGYLDASLSENTRRAYRVGLAAFRKWCDAGGVDALPASPESVAAFLAAGADAGCRPSTLGQRMAAIRWAHEAAGMVSPTASRLVRSTLSGIRREKGIKPERKAAATVDILSKMLSHADPGTIKGKRDRALLLFGFASAMRRSELVALELEDVKRTKRGLLVTLRRSKTDQEGHGREPAIPFGTREMCPIRALDAWLEAAGITEGRVFRSVTRHDRVGESLSPRAVAEVVKHYAKRAGYEAHEYSGHSLRAGFVTSAAERGKSTERIMDHTGHKTAAMVRAYTRRTDAFQDHAGEGLL